MVLDWDDLRFLLALARERTMSAAARALGVAQPTVGRRIVSFERKLGAQLFLRSGEGWTLSASGRSVFERAERMEEQALAAESAVAGRDAGLEGRVRITASEWMIASVLGPRLHPILSRHPDLSIELIAEARHLNLFRREADIAVRPSRFQQREVFQREIAVVQFVLYASDDYLAREGLPDFGSRGAGHRLIGAGDQMGTRIVDLEWLPGLIGNARVPIRVNGRAAMASMATAGAGIACLPRFVGDATPLRLIPTPTPPPRRQLWLGVHRSARTVRRVKVVCDYIADTVRALRPSLDPSR